MAKRSRFIPYSFRGKLMAILLLSTLIACTLTAAGSFMASIGALNDDLAEKEHEIAIYLLGLEQKTDLDIHEMLAVTSNDTLIADVSLHPEWTLSVEEMTSIRHGEIITQTHGLSSMPFTYVQLGEKIISIHPARDVNLFLSVLPRIAFSIILSLFLFALMSVLVSFSLSKPVTQLTQATRQIGEGDFTVRLSDKNHGEMGELMRSFNSMTDELSRTAYLQKDFISSIAHEFRTPITSIKGFARLLQMPGLDENTRQEYVSLIVQESDRLSRLSDTLLRLSALEQQMAPASLSIIRLDEQVRQVILQLEPAWSARHIKWQLDLDSVSIETDAELLMQVWINLIQNAIKFSSDGGLIEITVRRTDVADFIITDHGEGMSAETQERIFDRFFQGDSSRSKEGVGLGLCLVKRIVDILGGSVRVHSAPEKGSTFRIQMPLQQTTTRNE